MYNTSEYVKIHIEINLKEIFKMKKIIALVLVLSLSAFCFAACNKNKDKTPEEKTYTLAIAIDSSVDDSNKLSNYVAAIVIDADNKIVAARIDCAETTIAITEGAIANATVTTKVELGDKYAMTSGSFAKQTKLFEDAIVGKTADEVKNLDMATVAGCTMPYSPFSFKAVIAKAFASANKTTFKTADAFTLGLAADMAVNDGKATTNFGAAVIIGGKIAATVLDVSERSFSVVENAIVAGEYNGTKVELGDKYAMTSGSFAKQTEAFENAIVGKTADEVASLDMATVSGCTMPYSPAAFKSVIAKTFTYAR